MTTTHAVAADATPERRAQAEASWTPASPQQECPCSGGCRHGRLCDICRTPIRHLNRRPSSKLDLTVWVDQHTCLTCGSRWETTVDLPGVPFGEWIDPRTVYLYPGIRHPDCPDTWTNSEETP